MSKKNIQREVHYITVEPTEKTDKLLKARLTNYFALLSFLFLDKFLQIGVPSSVYFLFASSAAGLEIGQFINVLTRKAGKK